MSKSIQKHQNWKRSLYQNSSQKTLNKVCLFAKEELEDESEFSTMFIIDIHD